jgi:sulfur-oxidizing protein SoxB
VVAEWLRTKKVVTPRKLNTPLVKGMQGNPVLALST